MPGGLALSVNPTTLLALLTDLADSLERQGMRKLVLLNGHGGNFILVPIVQDLNLEFPDLLIGFIQQFLLPLDVAIQSSDLRF